MVYKMCAKCKRIMPWNEEDWSVVNTKKKGCFFLCDECTERLLKTLEEQEDDWRFTHG